MPHFLKLAPALALLVLAASPTLAQPGHVYNLNGSYADANGGPKLTPDGGRLGATGYTFGPNQGLRLRNATKSSVYHITLRFRLTDVSGYRKLIDFKNLATDDGLYLQDGKLRLYPTTNGTTPVAANTLTEVTLDRNAAGTVTGFVNGVQQFQFTDSTGRTTLSTAGDQIHFFEDDHATSQNEASGGFVDQITIDAPKSLKPAPMP